ncbi:MAG: Tim44-like domain-containing protein [Oleispira sp.]
MKSIITVFTAFFLMFAMVSEADAKRFGGGGFGKSFKTSPFASKKATPAKDTSQKQAGQKKGGMMGGLMGGLLAGGIFAALLGSGAFEDIQIMDMIIMAALAFLAFKLFKGFMSGGARSRQQPSVAGLGGHQPQQRQSFEMPRDAGAEVQNKEQEAYATQATDFNQDEVPFNLPEGFDQKDFIEGALSHYRTVQESWNKGELVTIEEYVSPELFLALSQQRNKLAIAPQTEVVDLTAEIVRADQAGDSAEISILFRGVCKDELEKSQDGIYDIWHLQRDLSTENADWVIVGIEAE